MNKTFIGINTVQSNQYMGIYVCSVHRSLFEIFNIDDVENEPLRVELYFAITYFRLFIFVARDTLIKNRD